MKTHLLFRIALVVFSFFVGVVAVKAQIPVGANQGAQHVFQEFSVLPNPFTDHLTINYTLPVETEVVVELYNALGQKVRQYSESAIRQDAGAHTITLFRPASTEPGIYFLRLTVPAVGSFTKRVMAQ